MRRAKQRLCETIASLRDNVKANVETEPTKDLRFPIAEPRESINTDSCLGNLTVATLATDRALQSLWPVQEQLFLLLQLQDLLAEMTKQDSDNLPSVDPRSAIFVCNKWDQVVLIVYSGFGLLLGSNLKPPTV